VKYKNFSIEKGPRQTGEQAWDVALFELEKSNIWIWWMLMV